MSSKREIAQRYVYLRTHWRDLQDRVATVRGAMDDAFEDLVKECGGTGNAMSELVNLELENVTLPK